MGKVTIARCPLCGWSRRYKGVVNSAELFNSPEADYVVMIQEVGGKHRRTTADLDRAVVRVGRGSARGKVEILKVIDLGDLDPILKEKIKQKTKKILSSIT